MPDRKRILLVDENEQILYGNRWLFEHSGYEVATARTLAEASVQIAENRPDVIVLDFWLPDGSGLEFMRKHRQGENAGIPILLFAGIPTPWDLVPELTQRGSDYLNKPYDFSELLAKTEALLQIGTQTEVRTDDGTK